MFRGSVYVVTFFDGAPIKKCQRTYQGNQESLTLIATRHHSLGWIGSARWARHKAYQFRASDGHECGIRTSYPDDVSCLPRNIANRTKI